MNPILVVLGNFVRHLFGVLFLMSGALISAGIVIQMVKEGKLSKVLIATASVLIAAGVALLIL